jgi:hypothetical protein
MPRTREETGFNGGYIFYLYVFFALKNGGRDFFLEKMRHVKGAYVSDFFKSQSTQILLSLSQLRKVQLQFK